MRPISFTAMRFLKLRTVVGLCLVAGLASGIAYAAETVTYKYDAKGRLVQVKRTGTVNNNVTTDYTHDKANNRTKAKTTGSTNTPSP
jgi:hypothetical protein